MSWLLVLKPAFYIAAFVVAHYRFKSYGPHTNLPPWLGVPLAGCVRTILGVAGFLAIAKVLNEFAFYGGLLGLGFLWWFVVAKGFFSRAPRKDLLVFAALAEVMTIVIDAVLLVQSRDFRMC